MAPDGASCRSGTHDGFEANPNPNLVILNPKLKLNPKFANPNPSPNPVSDPEDCDSSVNIVFADQTVRPRDRLGRHPA